jgi:hypothetical protein
MTFDSDRGGVGALMVTLVPSCHPRGTPMPPDVLGATTLRQLQEAFGPRYVATRYYRFRGGCMIFELNLARETRSTLTSDAAAMVNLVSRSTIDSQLAEAGLGP